SWWILLASWISTPNLLYSESFDPAIIRSASQQSELISNEMFTNPLSTYTTRHGLDSLLAATLHALLVKSRMHPPCHCHPKGRNPRGPKEHVHELATYYQLEPLQGDCAFLLYGNATGYGASVSALEYIRGTPQLSTWRWLAYPPIN